MPFTPSRVKITLDASIMNLVILLAKQEHKSVPALAKELVLEALECREDRFLSELAQKRDNKVEKRVKHKY